jgi:orotate phosphoribosyltransferase
LVDRSGGQSPDFGCKFVSLAKLHVETFEPDRLPPDLAAIPVDRPGSK